MPIFHHIDQTKVQWCVWIEGFRLKRRGKGSFTMVGTTGQLRRGGGGEAYQMQFEGIFCITFLSSTNTPLQLTATIAHITMALKNNTIFPIWCFDSCLTNEGYICKQAYHGKWKYFIKQWPSGSIAGEARTEVKL